MLSRTLHNLRDYYWHGPPLRLSGDGTRHHWHRPGTVMSGLTCQCLRLRYGHSESVLPQNFSLLDSHASSLRPDSASKRLQVRFCPLLSPFRPGRGSLPVVVGDHLLHPLPVVPGTPESCVPPGSGSSLQSKRGFRSKGIENKGGPRLGSVWLERSAKCKVQNTKSSSAKSQTAESGSKARSWDAHWVRNGCRLVCTNGNLKIVNRSPLARHGMIPHTSKSKSSSLYIPGRGSRCKHVVLCFTQIH